MRFTTYVHINTARNKNCNNDFPRSTSMKKRYSCSLIILNVIVVFLFSHGSGISTDTQTTLDRTSPLGISRVVGSVEQQIEAKNSTDNMEAIQDILTDMADMR